MQAHKLLHTFYVAGGPDKFDYAKAEEEEEARLAQGPAVPLGTKGEVSSFEAVGLVEGTTQGVLGVTLVQCQGESLGVQA